MRIQDWSADSPVRAFLASDQLRADKAVRAPEFGHTECAEVPLQSPFSRHFVAHFVGTTRVQVKCSLTKNCRFTAKHWILPPRQRLGQVLGTKNIPWWIICPGPPPGPDRGNCWQGNAPQDQRHGGWILNPERQSGRQSADKVRKLLDSSRQDVQTPGAGVPPAFWASRPCIFAGETPVHRRPEARATIFQTRSRSSVPV